jgi:hypothetical protein
MLLCVLTVVSSTTENPTGARPQREQDKARTATLRLSAELQFPFNADILSPRAGEKRPGY